MTDSSERTLVGEAFGRRFAVCGSSTLLDALVPLLPHGWTASSSAERTWTICSTSRGTHVLVDGQTKYEHLSAGDAVVHVARAVELWVAEESWRYVFLHAGVVAVGGHAIVLPGASRAGKSTLVAALVREGAHYYSDEFAILDASGLVHPYQRRPRQRPDSPALGWDPPAETRPPEPIPIALVTYLVWRPGSQLLLHTCSRASSTMMALQHAPAARSRPAAVLDFVTTGFERTEAIHGIRDDALVAARALLSWAGHTLAANPLR